MARNYASEYARRLSLGLERGETRQEARGHRRTPERPIAALRNPERYSGYISERPETFETLSDTRIGRAALARVNQQRMAQGKAPLVVGPPPFVPTNRYGTEETLGEAERHTEGIPGNYRTIYIWSSGYTWEVRSTERRSRRKAA